MRPSRCGVALRAFLTEKRIWSEDSVELNSTFEGRKTGFRNLVSAVKESGNRLSSCAIARALVTEPLCVLADEPTGALDYQTGVLVLDALSAINRDLGTTTVVITHNVAIARMANRVIYFSDGQVARTEQNTQKAAPADLRW